MQIINKLRNPINWLLGLVLKRMIWRLFFNKVENKDFNDLVSYTIFLLLNETIINTFKLLIDLIMKKPSELFKIKTINKVLIHTLPIENRNEIVQEEQKSIKYLLISLVFSNIIKKILFIFKTVILFPFKLGVYGFIAFLFGIKVDWLLSFFDIFNFNLPSWTYKKLVELHIRWMILFKDILQIESINTDLDAKNSTLKTITYYKEKETTFINSDSKPETYLYLTKTQWFYVSITILGMLGAYFGYTGGIPFTKTFEWSSDNKHDDDSSNDNGGDLRGKRSIRTSNINPRDINIIRDENPNTWQDTLTRWTTNTLEKIKKTFFMV